MSPNTDVSKNDKDFYKPSSNSVHPEPPQRKAKKPLPYSKPTTPSPSYPRPPKIGDRQSYHTNGGYRTFEYMPDNSWVQVSVTSDGVHKSSYKDEL